MKIYSSIDNAYEDYGKYIRENGELRTDERGDILYQIPFYHIEFEYFTSHAGTIEYMTFPKHTHLNKEALREYREQFEDPNEQGFVYTYGNRLRHHFMRWYDSESATYVDQIDYIIKKIQHNPSTRRAVAVTLDPAIDDFIDDIPCLQHIQLSVYDKKLCMYVLFRSNDIRYAFVPNMYGLMSLHLDLAHKLGYNVGRFYYTSYNPHWKLK